MFARSLLHLRRLAALSLVLAPLAAHADVGISVGYTGEHDSQRGQVYNLDWVPEGYSWDLTAGVPDSLDRALQRDRRLGENWLRERSQQGGEANERYSQNRCSCADAESSR